MIRLKPLAVSGLVLSLAATGLAFAQQPSPPAAATQAASEAKPADDAAMADDEDMTGDDADADDAGSMAMDDGEDADNADDSGAAAPKAGAEAATTGHGEGRPQGRMGWMDTDRDGAIERSELGVRQAERLHGADKNGDGVLSREEVEAMVLNQIAERRARRMMNRLDVDGDGKVTLAEIDRMRDKRFAVMDLNDDGRIDTRELGEIHRGVEGYGGMGRHGRDGGMHRGNARFDDHGGRFGRDGWRQRHHDDRMDRHGGDRDAE